MRQLRQRMVTGYLQGLHLPSAFGEEDEQPPESNPSFPTAYRVAVATNMPSLRSKDSAMAARSVPVSAAAIVRLLSRAAL